MRNTHASRLSFLLLVSATALAGLAAPAAAGSGGSPPPADGRIVVIDGASDDRLATVNPDGTGVRPVPGIEGFAQHPAWTPDGRIVFVVDTAGPWRLTEVRPDGTGLRTILEDGDNSAFTPDVTPDGRRIVFSRCVADESCDLYTVRFDGTGLTKLTESGNGDGDFWPEVSPDGRRIAFNRFGARGITVQTWVMRIDGSQARPITAPALEAGRPRWLPGTDRVVFTDRWVRFGANIRSVRDDGSGLRQLTAVVWPHSAGNATASPSGRTILYADDTAYSDLIGNDLWTMNPDGSGKRLILPGLWYGSDWGTAALLPAAASPRLRGDLAPDRAQVLPESLTEWAGALNPRQRGASRR